MTNTLAPSQRYTTALELRRLRAEAQTRHSEVDLLVAALRDHIRDLRAERDALRAEVARAMEQRQLETSSWLWRGMKP